MKAKAKIKYKLELKGLKLKDLSDHLGITPDGLYKKLTGNITLNEEEKEKINQFLELSKTEISRLW